MKAKLTATKIKSLSTDLKPYEVRDTEIKGFLLRVSPAGKMVYYLDYRTQDGKRNRYRIGTVGNVTPAQARDVAVKQAASVAQGKDLQQERKQEREKAIQDKYSTLQGFLDHKYGPWVEAERKTGTATMARIRFNFKRLLNRSLTEITPWVVEKWRAEQVKKGKAKTTINRDVVALKAAMSKAVAWKIIDVHPLLDVKPIKTDHNSKVRYLTETEERRLRKALKARDEKKKAERESGNQWRKERGYEEMPLLDGCVYADHLTPLTLLTLNTGLRRGEAFDLTWSHVNFQVRTLTVVGDKAKSEQTRHIPLNDESLSVLSAWRAQGHGNGLVFPARDGGRLDSVRKSWAGILSNAEIVDFRWHDLRHSFASKLVMRGVPLNTVRELLGHKDLTTTLRYAHLAPDHKADAVALLG